jgi:imidazolonepropionase-like amidohydrolase
MKKNIFAIALFFCCMSVSHAQPLPAVKQTEPILITDATVHVGNGKVIQHGVIGFVDGKITFVGTIVSSDYDRNIYKKIISAAGKHVYPGLIAPNTHLGLVELESTRATLDNIEVGELNPSVRSIVAYNTDSQIIPTVRSNGILIAEIAPGGGRISGSSTVVELDAWNWEDAVHDLDNGIHLNFPQQMTRSFDGFDGFSLKKNEKYAKEVLELENFFKESQGYALAKTSSNGTKNLKMEAMRGIFDGSKTVFVHTESAKEMMEAVTMLSKYTGKLVIVGGRESYMIADWLANKKIGVVLDRTQSLPSHEDEDYDQPYKTPVQLQKAGVVFALSNDGGWQNRNLPFMAGQTVAFGLSKEEALSAVTNNTAKLLGIDKTLGTLEVGKDATLIISDGDILDMKTSAVSRAFIRGKDIDLNNKQRDNAARFQAKYSH